MAVQKNAGNQGHMAVQKNVRNQSRMAVQKNARNQGRMAVRKNAGNQSRIVVQKDAGNRSRIVVWENRVRWDQGENQDLLAVLECVENQARRESLDPKGHKAPPVQWGQEENKVPRVPQDLLVVHKTVYLHHFQGRGLLCREMPIFHLK